MLVGREALRREKNHDAALIWLITYLGFDWMRCDAKARRERILCMYCTSIPYVHVQHKYMYLDRMYLYQPYHILPIFYFSDAWF